MDGEMYLMEMNMMQFYACLKCSDTQYTCTCVWFGMMIKYCTYSIDIVFPMPYYYIQYFSTSTEIEDEAEDRLLALDTSASGTPRYPRYGCSALIRIHHHRISSIYSIPTDHIDYSFAAFNQLRLRSRSPSSPSLRGSKFRSGFVSR